jgi:triosephosphate isomerase (TIM)
MRKPIIAGNWKMNKTPSEAAALAKEILEKVQDVKDVEVVVAPTFVCLDKVGSVIKGTNLKLSSQNIFWEDSGAYTGEISASMLKDLSVEFVIVGHSERRQFFNETDETVNKRIKKALAENLKPIVCVGETLEQREADETIKVVSTQVKGALQGITAEDMQSIVVAYEPVWAIGTGKTATKEQANDVHVEIRKVIAGLYDQSVADAVRIQYGGSVNPGNVKELMSMSDIDGALVGGASLKADSFESLVKF